MRSLVGHTVGGAAGAFSRITGAMGHGIAALSMDKDYQKQRRDGMNKPPQSLQEGLARSGRGLVMVSFNVWLCIKFRIIRSVGTLTR